MGKVQATKTRIAKSTDQQDSMESPRQKIALESLLPLVQADRTSLTKLQKHETGSIPQQNQSQPENQHLSLA